MEEQDVPSAAGPSSQTTGGGSVQQSAPTPVVNHGDDWERVPPEGNNSAPPASAPQNMPVQQIPPDSQQPTAGQPASAPAQAETPGSATPEPAPSMAPIPTETPSSTPTPEPPPALDVSSIDTDSDAESKPLDAEIKTAVTPSMAASLRVTEQARKQLSKGAIDAALRSLTQAVSIDPGDPFEYYFLGRAHYERKNYQQALTFFQRAQLGFANKPQWLGETLSYEGACDEALGHELEAAKAYQKAVAASPGNFRARVGYGRLSAILAPTPSAELPPASSDSAPPAPSAPIDAPPPAEPAAPPAQ
ncbi:MAG TPA: tetratricopeptide repeat protein [Candidatus Binataceae bacterium]|nr:tetratricopeptide repeat protein [Candidatus Binataceae bacterium]